MDQVDATKIAERALRLGLLQNDQVEEGWEVLGKKGGEAIAFLKAMENRRYLTPYQSSKLLKDDKDGYFYGGFRILYKISSGSFGRVYRAEDPRTGRIVAVKVLRKKWSEDKRNIELFEREGKLGLTLRHPNIVEIISVSQDQLSKSYYIIMEFVEGGNLRDFLSIRKKLEPLEAIKLLEETSAGLAYAFGKGYTHRDMKATNILISSQGTAKLVDFGLAEMNVAQNMLAKKEDDLNVDRTVDYAGLEKATGVPPGDTRSDIFFLGCVAFQMLTGRFPLEMSRNAQARMKSERFGKIVPMSDKEVNAPQSVFRLIESMMSLDPNRRFQTPSQLLDAIHQVRLELEGKSQSAEGNPKAKPESVQKTVFIVENDEKLQDVLREKLREKGYRVLIAGDPQRALDRFRQQSFDLLIVDCGTTEETGYLVFNRILEEAYRQKIACFGILMIREDQEKWKGKITTPQKHSILVHPVKLKNLLKEIQDILSGKE